MAQTGLIKGLGLLDATTLVIGSMIGSGVFIVAADISRQVASPGLMIMTWIVTALLTIIAALSYGELAAAMPQAGGQYVYLREAFGPMSGFLFGWTMFMVIQTGTIAAVAVAFAKFAGVFIPWIAADNYIVPKVSTQQLVGIAVIVLLTLVNTRGIRTGAMVQNIFTIAKTGALIGLIAVGFLIGRNQTAIDRNFTDFWQNADWTFTTIRLVGVAIVGALFSSDAWNNVTSPPGKSATLSETCRSHSRSGSASSPFFTSARTSLTSTCCRLKRFKPPRKTASPPPSFPPSSDRRAFRSWLPRS